MTPAWRTFCVRIGAGVALFAAVEAGLILWVDRPLAEGVRAFGNVHPSTVAFFQVLTVLGLGGVTLIPSGLGALIALSLARWTRARHRSAVHAFLRLWGERLAFVFAAVAVPSLATTLIKKVVGRARPKLWLHEHIYGLDPGSFAAAWNSWPSGHSTTIFALAYALSVLWPRGTWVWGAGAVLVAFSRVMINAHFLSDVLAGACVGLLLSFAVHHLGAFGGKNLGFPSFVRF